MLTAFQETLVIRPLILSRTISSGNETKVPLTWKKDAAIHGRGQRIEGKEMEKTERTLRLDERPIFAATEVDDIDEMMAHFEQRSIHSFEDGQALARTVDRRLASVLVRSARYTKAVGDESSFPEGGNSLTEDGEGFKAEDLTSGAAADFGDVGALGSTAARDTAGAFLAAIDNAILEWEEFDVPEENRHAIIRPRLWHAVKTFGVPYAAAEIGNLPVFGDTQLVGPKFGDMSRMPRRTEPLLYNDILIWKSKQIPCTNINFEEEAAYRGDFTKTQGVIFNQWAAAMLLLMGDMMIETSRQHREGTDLITTKMLMGCDPLRPEAAFELVSNDE